jgi:lipoprotein NlpD
MSQIGREIGYSLFMVPLLMALTAGCANTGRTERYADIAAVLNRNADGNKSKKVETSMGLSHPRLPARNIIRIAEGARYYEVCKGDTLYSISKQARINLITLANWNDIPPPYHVYEGQKINLFNPSQTENQLRKATEDPLQQPKEIGKIAPEKNIGQMQKIKSVSQKKLIFSDSREKVLKFYCVWPIKGKVLKNFSQSGNKGIDIDAHYGEAVEAVAAGKVVFSGEGLRGYGKLLIIEHHAGFLSAYGNNSKLLVNKGQRVEQGLAIAEAGRGPGGETVLHFELRKNGKPVNPLEYLPK